MSVNNWFVVTGGPSTGKTTLLLGLKKRGYKIIPEAARTLIDESLQEGISVGELRFDEKLFQEKVALLKKQIENKCDRNEIVFFDRGMHDTLAYMREYNFDINGGIMELMDTSVYNKVFLLEPLPTFENDYARTENSAFTKSLHQQLFDVYREYGMNPIVVKVASPRERLEFVINNLNNGV